MSKILDMSKYDEYFDDCDNFPILVCLKDVQYSIKKQPTVDAVPTVHAHWKYDPNGMDWNIGAWRCSVCGCRNNNIGCDEKLNPLLFAGSKYCPNCGARMDEETTNETNRCE